MIGVSGVTGHAALSAHAALAAALGGALSVGESLAGPVFAPAVSFGSAVLTAGIAVHAVHRTAHAARVPAGRLLRHAAAATARSHGDLLATHALDLASRVHHRERSAWVYGASLIGRCAGDPVRMAMRHLALGWWRPLTCLRTAGGAFGASRAAVHGAGFLGRVQSAALEAASGVRCEGVAS